MARVVSAIVAVAAVMLATGTLVAVLGTMIGFYDWMWGLVVLGAVVGLVIARERE